MQRISFGLFAAAVVGLTFAQDPAAKPPAAKKVPHKVELHGESWADEYFWIKDKKNPDVIKHLEAENA